MGLKKYTKEELIAIPKSFNSRLEFARGREGAYRVCCRRGILDEVCAHMTPKKRGRKFISDEILLERLKDVKLFSELMTKKRSLYRLILGRFGSEPFQHLKKYRKLTIDNIKEIVKGRTLADLRVNDRSIYQTIKRRKLEYLLDENKVPEDNSFLNGEEEW